jgi:hypothetical protein
MSNFYCLPGKAGGSPGYARAYKVAFEKAVKCVKNSDGKAGHVKFKSETDCYPFRMKESLPVVKRAVAAVSAGGGTPTISAANGGLDANWMGRHGVPTVTLRRRAERAAHDRRVDQSRRIRPGVCARSPACDDAVICFGKLAFRNIHSTQESVRNCRVVSLSTRSALLFFVRRRSVPKHGPHNANKEQHCDWPVEPDSVQTGENID